MLLCVVVVCYHTVLYLTYTGVSEICEKCAWMIKALRTFVSRREKNDGGRISDI
jgi:hypothetical protein